MSHKVPACAPKGKRSEWYQPRSTRSEASGISHEVPAAKQVV
jgi:hypothetical protein